MSWINDAKLSTKLITAFALCAFITLGVGLLGLAVLAVLVFVSVFVGAAMIAGGLLYRLLRQRGKPVARDHAMEGEYRVVRKQALPLPR